MNAVLDNFDLVPEGLRLHRLASSWSSGVLSLLLGTLLAAMRVGPVAVLRKAGADLRHPRPQHPAGDHLPVLPARRCQGLDVCASAGSTSTSASSTSPRSSAPPSSSLTPLHLGLRLRGAPLRRQRRAARPGRGRAGDRAAVRRRDAPGGAAPGRSAPRCRRWPASRSRCSRTPRSPRVFGVIEAAAQMKRFTNDYADRALGHLPRLRARLHRPRRGRLARRHRLERRWRVA